jgi:hypothetical protein
MIELAAPERRAPGRLDRNALASALDRRDLGALFWQGQRHALLPRHCERSEAIHGAGRAASSHVGHEDTKARR